MKKDILAAFTFIMTGLLFYVVQTDARGDQLLSSETECEAAGSLVISEKMPEAPPEFTLQDEGTRDS